jgi:hypothetical protein
MCAHVVFVQMLMDKYYSEKMLLFVHLLCLIGHVLHYGCLQKFGTINEMI